MKKRKVSDVFVKYLNDLTLAVVSDIVGVTVRQCQNYRAGVYLPSPIIGAMLIADAQSRGYALTWEELYQSEIEVASKIIAKRRAKNG